MKRLLMFCVILTVALSGCSGTKDIKPSDDSVKTNEAMEVINIIQAAYREKNSEVLAAYIHPVEAKNIIDELTFDSVDLNFKPWVVRIKESSTIINADWQGTWHYGDREIQRRGIADFVFIDSPVKLVHINGDNPFSPRPAEYDQKTGSDQGEPQPPAEEPQATPGEAQAPADEAQSGPPVPQAEQKEAAAEPSPEPQPEPAAEYQQPADMEPLQRTKLLYREHSLVPSEPPEPLNDAGAKKYIVQVGAWKNGEYAETALELVRGFYPEALIVEEGGFHKIRIKRMMDRQEGMLAVADLEEKFNLRPILIGLDAESPGDPTAVTPPDETIRYFVQIGVWRNREFAETAYTDLKKNYPGAVMVRAGNLHKVGIPVSAGRERAASLVREIKETLNMEAIIVEQ